MKYRQPKPETEAEQQRRQWLAGVKQIAQQIAIGGLTAEGQPEKMEQAVGALHQMAIDNMAIIERNAVERRKRGAQIPQVACREGCDFCCFLRVRAAIPEVLNLAEHLKANFSVLEIEQIITRIDANLDEFNGLDAMQRANKMVPCPLLVEHRCIAHDARPIQCRSHHSVDVEACKQGFVHPDTVQIPHFLDVDTVVAPIFFGLQSAVKAKNLKDEGVLLPAALKIALTEPAAQERWLSGEDVFGSATDHDLNQLSGAQANLGRSSIH